MEDDLNLFEKGRRPNFFEKSKTTSKKIMQPKTIKSKNNGCGTAPGNLVTEYYGSYKNFMHIYVFNGHISTN